MEREKCKSALEWEKRDCMPENVRNWCVRRQHWRQGGKIWANKKRSVSVKTMERKGKAKHEGHGGKKWESWLRWEIRKGGKAR